MAEKSMTPERSAYLLTLTYEQAERARNIGTMTADEWEWWLDLWQTSAPRFSHLGGAHQIL